MEKRNDITALELRTVYFNRQKEVEKAMEKLIEAMDSAKEAAKAYDDYMRKIDK